MVRQGKSILVDTAIALVIATVPSFADGHDESRTANDGQVVLDGVPEIPERIGRQLRRYQNVRGASFRDWTADGQGIYITTRFGETSQIHRVDTPMGARHQVTFFDEPVGGVSRQPRGSQLSMTMDEGGSENFQIFLLDPVSGSHRRLTDGESRNGAVAWSDDGARIAFQSTRRNGRSNDVWVMDVDSPDEASLALESPDGSWWGPTDWSADASKLLVMQYVSITDSRIHLVDLESGESRLIAGGEKAPGNFAGVTPQFDADGSGVFLASDRKGLFTELAHLDLASGELKTITGDILWNVDDLALSEDGKRGAFVVNEGGISKLYLFNPQSLTYWRVDQIPIGLIGGLEFSPDARRLAMTLNTARSPSDVYSLELGEGALQAGELVRWTRSEVGGLDTDSFIEPELVEYRTFDTANGAPRMIPAFVYKPSSPGPHPVVISIHGGPEGQYRPSFNSLFQLLLNDLEVAVIAPNVRGSTGYGKEYVRLDNGMLREDSVRDIGTLLSWIANQPDLDHERVAVYGGSYGGYMVLASLVHYSDRLRAGVDIVGISNFVTFLENTQSYRRDLRRVEYGDERDPEMREFLEKISPNRHAEKITAPLFVAQGANDPRVPVTESEQIVRDVRASGHDVWYMNALNEGHGFRKKENRDLYQEIVVLFLETHLLGGDREPDATEGP